MTKEDLKKFDLPDEPGIYLFRKGRKILYVGKATSLRDRVRSYFASDLSETRGPRIVSMIEMANSLTWTATDSVLEALILEANTIKEKQPPYNVDEKDNKSFNYLVLTKEEFPRLVLMRGRELFSAQGGSALGRQSGKKDVVWKIFGPFPHGGALKEALKIVRRIFPYRDSKCNPCGSPKNKACKPCFNRQIGLCPGVCTGEMSKDEYCERVAHIMELFSGNFKGLKRNLGKEMKAAAKAEDYEKAQLLRQQISALEHIRDVSLIKGDVISTGGGARIEAFDVAHTGGAETVAVMTVVNNGEMIKEAYRKFKIQTVTNNDVAALKEALSRRLNHDEWPLPRVFVVDGAAAQINAARKVLREAGIEVPIVGVVKNEFHKPERLIGDRRAIEAYEKDILLANGEAHRFGIGWHRRRMRRSWE